MKEGRLILILITGVILMNEANSQNDLFIGDTIKFNISAIEPEINLETNSPGETGMKIGFLNEGNYDFEFLIDADDEVWNGQNSNGNYFHYWGNESIEVCYVVDEYGFVPKRFEQEELIKCDDNTNQEQYNSYIGSSFNYLSHWQIDPSGGGESGNWTNNKIGSFVFRKFELNDTLYGWIELQSGRENGLYYINLMQIGYQGILDSIIIADAEVVADEEIEKRGVKIYPTIVSDYLKIELPEFEGESKIIIYDLRGVNLLERQILKEVELDVSILSSGLYIVQVQREAEIYVSKIYKENK